MALRIRKDTKKSSYYVWFLGAKESKGLRGKEYILPVIEHLVQREKDIEPFKVTLQVSHKGLKIIQTVLSTNPKTAKPKNETIKHFIPHNTITCVFQDEDIVSCILLLFNPVTKCPLHVHVYRCDSVETATLLKTQLETLIERPENQKKITDLESRIKAPKEKKKFDSSLGSDTGTSTRESESSEERFPANENRITNLYDSLAAELRAKLNKNESPILLPPRDYDTVHRQKGNLHGIDMRRCLNTSIVGQNAKGKRIESSGGSSGIGSDHAPSPDSPDSPERYNSLLDNQSTSDEEWNIEPTESTHYLLHGGQDMILPRASRHPETTKFSPEPPKSPEYPRFNPRYPEPEQKFRESTLKHEAKPRSYERYETTEPKAPETSWRNEKEYYQRYHEEKFINKYENEPRRTRKTQEEERFVDNGYKEQKNIRNGSKGYHDEFDEEEEYREKKKEEIVPRPRSKQYHPEERYYQEEKSPRSKFSDEFYQNESKPRYFDGEREKIRTKFPPDDPRFYSEYEEKRSEFYRNSKYHPEERYYHENKTLEKPKMKFNSEDPRFYTDSRHSEKSSRSKYSQEDAPRSKYSQEEAPRSKYSQDETPRPKYPDEYFDDTPEPRRRAEDRQRSPSPLEVNASPKDRFKDAKEKFLLLERERLEEERSRRHELHHSTPNLKDKTFLKRHESMIHPKERYHEERRYEIEPRYQPKPAPRTIVPEEEVRYRRDIPLDRYRNQEDRYDQSRRPMFNQIEEEHKKNSNEIARELKRRSYMENDYHKEKYEIPDTRRHPGLDREPYNFSKSNVELDKVGEKFDHPKYVQKVHQKFKQPAGYRHSYAEPKMSLERIGKKLHPEMIHRTNSTVSNSGRVGIASVNPY